MTSDAIRSKLDSNPFLPLRVRMVSGCEYRFTLPGQLSLFGPESRKSLMLNGTGKEVRLDEVISIESEPALKEFVANRETCSMTTGKFDEFLNRRPFVPFTIHVTDGGSFEVKGPEFASRTQNGRTIFVATGGEKTEWIDLLLVTRISSGVNNPSVSSR